uniref:Uncharacterized protein n=1 Tax=Chromera velia CCMP2878 TaxID=1169474 RepID=A0A0G4HTW2_9ALVE|mmetsp:Transcript_55383/g.108415  ORF Transcript_55383/g.108415 Transcript_55383/m.108415 type:complete len:127 (-) Transcript_55383:940-1320(-)|eukprot:Cvel_8521.t1-p1 / transcript=Cvel_8521.t1 / gene=Cvel_8521 / organism=Chromera_velia_CCMP2878 / gene_product=hypothetical protein / transcript_product=hypothetical protein / location=Cvel_scaffold472:12759-13136(-) / protein_length=126 / sequence_SO=supercontig / SO=protein_coding / is_pseudo=false
MVCPFCLTAAVGAGVSTLAGGAAVRGAGETDAGSTATSGSQQPLSSRSTQGGRGLKSRRVRLFRGAATAGVPAALAVASLVVIFLPVAGVLKAGVGVGAAVGSLAWLLFRRHTLAERAEAAAGGGV